MMRNSNNNRLIGALYDDYVVGKPSENKPFGALGSGYAWRRGERKKILRDQVKASFQCIGELGAEPGSFSFVPFAPSLPQQPPRELVRRALPDPKSFANPLLEFLAIEELCLSGLNLGDASENLAVPGLLDATIPRPI
jgi:hypothetical protein